MSEKEFKLRPSESSSDGHRGETDRFLASGTGAFSDARDEEMGAEGVRSPPADRVAPIPAKIIIPIWIMLSGCIILFNKHIFTTLNFPYPVFLTFFHMTVATVGTRLLRLIPGRVSPSKVDMPVGTASVVVADQQAKVKLQIILPMAVMFSLSLILSNIAYVHLSVSFVQMLKAFIPILVLIIQLAAGLQAYNHLLLGVISLTCLGCFIAANGEVQFSVLGFVCQTSAVVVESIRLVLVQLLLKDYKMDPLTSIAMYSPICVVLIGIVMPVMEGSAPWLLLLDRVGIPTLLLNGAVAFALNVAGVFLIDSAGSVVLTLSGVFKDVLLITFSVILLGSSITPMQVVGYAIALTGLLSYRLTGGSENSPLGQKVVKVFTSVSNARHDKVCRIVRTLPVVCAFVMCGLAVLRLAMTRPANDLSWSALSSTPPPLPQRSVSYPLLPGSHVSVNGKGNMALYTQHGPGLDVIPPFDPSIDVLSLPRIAWVIVATPDVIGKYSHQLDQIACYCAKTGIPFHLEHSVFVDDKNFMTARHRSVAKYLRYYQWLMVTDADTIVADSSPDPREWLNNTQDVIVNDRGNAEICACAFFIRNSPGGWSFLRRWFAWADNGPRFNYDNGDLNEMILAGMKRGVPNNEDYTGRFIGGSQAANVSGSCVNSAGVLERNQYVEFLSCMDERLRETRMRDHRVPYWDATLWAWTNNKALPKVSLRSYKPFAGFLRPAEGKRKGEPWLSASVLGDFLFGGKELHVFIDEDSILCTGKDWQVQPKWSVEEARETLGVEGNMPWWPGCWDDDGSYHCQSQDLLVEVKASS